MFGTKTKVKTFNGVVHAIFCGDKIPKKMRALLLHSRNKYRFCNENG